ncbi:MAG: hypothetical protein IJM47_09890 [Synergistaceae bacterium]|nr:hypothetical protein [Synergistaceae bacterium]MBQ9905079.1 hypothetical protein [Synergistaceae bacterium]
MSKKLSAIILAVIYALYGQASFGETYNSVKDKGAELADTISYLASQIITNNKHVLQVKLTKNERTHDVGGKSVVSPYTLNRIWAKDSTVVCGCAKKDKKFEVEHMVTNDNKFFFAGGIHVGDDLGVFTEFLGVPLTEAAELCEGRGAGWEINHTSKGGTVTWNSASEAADSFVLYYNEKGVITQIEYFTNKSYMPVSDNALDFFESKLRELRIFR